MSAEDIENRFTHHPPVVDQVKIYKVIRDKAKEYALFLNETLPEGREKSLSITHLEETAFWANAAIARMKLE